MRHNSWIKFLNGVGIGITIAVALVIIMGAGLHHIGPGIQADFLSLNKIRKTLQSGTSGQTITSDGSGGVVMSDVVAFGLSTVAQGDMLYASATDTLAKLAKSTRPGVAIRNTGTSNNPAYGPIRQLVYSATAASNSHTGVTAAETTVMPTADEGTGDTDLSPWLLTGAVLDWTVDVPLTGDADGNETLTVNVYIGSQLVGTSGAINDDGTDELHLEGRIKIRAGGATGTGFYSYQVSHNTAFLSMDEASISSTDFTATTPFVVKLDWGGTTDAADTATVQDANIEATNWD